MFKKITLALILASAAAPAMAQSACKAPTAPAAVDGAKVTVDQLKAAISDAKAFIAASDTYQTCVGDELNKQKAAATPDKPFDPAIEAAAMVKVNDNQAQKQKVGDAINGAIGDYKKAHPG
jgi:hypothetical protein